MKFICTAFLAFLFYGTCFSQKQKVWLDSDTGNEMDDLYAITRLLKDTTIEVAGLSSAHFNNADLLVFEKWNGYFTKNLNPVAESQRLNIQILQSLNLSRIPHPIGADRQIGRSWGEQDPRPSEASEAIVKTVKSLAPDEILDIITLGPLTNIASAILTDTSIISHIRCYSLGANYYTEEKVWDKSEFNIRNDLNAFNYLLNLKEFDITIMPLQTAYSLQFNKKETYANLNETILIEKILKNRWQEHNPQDEIRNMWDLALVEAYLLPKFSEIKKVVTPPENRPRMIGVYTHINEKLFYADFWKSLKE